MSVDSYTHFSKGLKHLLFITVLIYVFALPFFVSAQTAQSDLREAIQFSIMADPRVADVPPAQLNALIDALFVEAQAQNITAAEILGQPQRAAVGDTVVSLPQRDCASGWQGFLCQLEHTFGFAGSNYELPIILIVVSGLLILVIWELIAHHRKVLAQQAASRPKAPTAPKVQ